VAVAAFVVLLVAGPVAFTHRNFSSDFTNHLWLMWNESTAIRAHGHPTLYLQARGPGQPDVFTPFFGFYGGTLYSVVGTLSAVLAGRPVLAYSLSIVGAIAVAYAAMYWLGHQCGLRWPARHVPAVIFVTSAYYLTDLYARGAWPEFIALSMLPIVVAAGLHLLTRPWRPASVAAFAFGCIGVSGSHNISLLWFGLLIAIIGAACWLVAGSRRPSPGRTAAVIALAVLCGCVNGWFLLFDVAHSGSTVIGQGGFGWLAAFGTPAALLTPFRTAPFAGAADLTVAAPVLAIVAAIAVRAVSPSGRRLGLGWLGRLWWVVAVGLTLTLVLMMWREAWKFLGSPFTLIQFPYRLSGPVAFLSAVLLMLALRFAQERQSGSAWSPRAVVGVLVAVTLVQTGLQLHSNFVRSAGSDRNLVLASGPSVAPLNLNGNAYRNASLPAVPTSSRRAIAFPTPEPGGTRASATIDLASGRAPVLTNIAAGPYAVRVEGARVIGRSIGQTTGGYLVVQPLSAAGGPTQITVVADAGAMQTLGAAITAVALALIGALLVVLRLRSRRNRPALAPPDDGGAGSLSVGLPTRPPPAPPICPAGPPMTGGTPGDATAPPGRTPPAA
jgi:hypothetical protein